MTARTAAPDDDVIRCEPEVASVGGQLILRLPEAASAALPSRGQVSVTGTIDEQPFAVVVEPDGRRGHWIRLSDLPVSLGDLAAGQRVSVTLVPSSEWPEPGVPDDLRAALDDAPDLDELWATITPMARWEWVRWISSTRNAATRAKRVDVGISKMRDGKRRPCCFDLSACTDPELARSGKLMADDAAD